MKNREFLVYTTGMLQLFGFISGFFATIEFIPYIRDILRGKTKPQRTTFFIYAILNTISFSSQLAKGATNSLWLPFVFFIGTLTVFILSIKNGVGGFQKKDFVALFIAAVGLIAWYFTKEAAIALYLVILVDAAGTSLTIEKAYKNPESETIITWVLSSLAGLLALLSVGSLNPVLISFPLFIFFIDGAVVMAVLLGKRRKK